MPKTRAEIGVFSPFFGTPKVRDIGVGIFVKKMEQLFKGTSIFGNANFW
jgi:hypothetical protein